MQTHSASADDIGAGTRARRMRRTRPEGPKPLSLSIPCRRQTNFGTVAPSATSARHSVRAGRRWTHLEQRWTRHFGISPRICETMGRRRVGPATSNDDELIEAAIVQAQAERQAQHAEASSTSGRRGHTRQVRSRATERLMTAIHEGAGPAMIRGLLEQGA
jgi:hypothetical protein